MPSSTNPRDHCLFTLGVNSAFRGGDLLALNLGDFCKLKAGNELVRRDYKTGKVRRVTMNLACVQALQALVATPRYAGATENCSLFVSQKQGWCTPDWGVSTNTSGCAVKVQT